MTPALAARVLLATIAMSLLGCSRLIEAGDATYTPASGSSDTVTLDSGSLRPGAYFGSAVTLWGDELIVTAPGAALRGVQSSADATCNVPVDVAEGGRIFAFEWDGESWEQPVRELERGPADDHDTLISVLALPETRYIATARTENLLALGFPAMDYTRCLVGGAATEPIVDAGGVDLYERGSDGGWRRMRRLTSSHPTQMGTFGSPMVMSDDWLFVGASVESAPGPEGDEDEVDLAGVVYAFERQNGEWVERQRLSATNALPNAFFGTALALDGDTLAVGAVGDSHAEPGVDPEPSGFLPASGAAYVFRNVGGHWEQEAYIKAENPDVNDVFGISLALEGDTLLVGATLEAAGEPLPYADSATLRASDDDEMMGAGAVYAYRRGGDRWTFHAYIKAPEPQPGAGFGTALALSHGRLLIGATYEGVDGSAGDVSADDSGAAYLYDEIEPGAEPQLLRPEPRDPRAQYGYAVALSDHWAVLGGPADGSEIGGARIFDVSQ